MPCNRSEPTMLIGHDSSYHYLNQKAKRYRNTNRSICAPTNKIQPTQPSLSTTLAISSSVNALNVVVLILPIIRTFSPNRIAASSLEPLDTYAIIFAKCSIWCEFATNLFCLLFLLLLAVLWFPWSFLSLDPSTSTIGYIAVQCYKVRKASWTSMFL